jgi:hypothetical protein
VESPFKFIGGVAGFLIIKALQLCLLSGVCESMALMVCDIISGRIFHKRFLYVPLTRYS